jgi:hypothetical protein
MTDAKYNGWTNYATWRVRLEMFDGYDGASDNDLDAYDLGQMLRADAEELVTAGASGLSQDYALAFLADVDWTEIAQAMIDDYREADARGNGIANCGYDERGECEVNARLIAAAPDMLAALERAYQKLGFWMDDDKWDDGDEAVMVQIWAALAKARGA